MGVVHRVYREKDTYRFRMKVLLLVSVFLPALEAICAIQGCDKYWAANKNNREVTGACAVVFDENCCKASDDHYTIKRMTKENSVVDYSVSKTHYPAVRDLKD